MSTNYYMQNKCGACGNVKQVHLGKSSSGWTFTFRGETNLGVVDFNSWILRVRVLQEAGYRLVDEYGQAVGEKGAELDFLFDLVASKKKEPNNQAKQYATADGRDWCDDDGNSFTDREFS